MASPAPAARAPHQPSNLARALAQHSTRKPTSNSPPNAIKETAGSPPRQTARGADINDHKDSSVEDARTGSLNETSAKLKQQAMSPVAAESQRILAEAQRVTTTREQHSHLSSKKVLGTSPPSRRLHNTTIRESHKKQAPRKALPSAMVGGGRNMEITASSAKQNSASHTQEQRVALLAERRQAARELEYQQKKSRYDRYRKEHSLTGDTQDARSEVLKEEMDAAKAKGNVRYDVQKASGTHKRKASTSGSSDLGDGGHTRIRRSPPSRRATTPLPKLTDPTEASAQATLTEGLSKLGVSEKRHKSASSMSALSALSSTDRTFPQKAENPAASTTKTRRFFGLI